MELLCESNSMNDYLKESDVVDYSHPVIVQTRKELFYESLTDIEKVKIAFEYVRDQIHHSWDIQSTKVTCRASEVLIHREGICYAKSSLLAALLRAEKVPTGFCYQRLMIFDSPEKGYSLHAFNGVFLSSLNKWIRLDARGNKPGVQAEFSINEEILAFPVREYLDEIDYLTIYVEPNQQTIAVLENSKNALKMYQHDLPSFI
ncbi:transglutaminase family protein [Bacillus sp. FJAT-49732]|uniref:Transglutaminase family protein n=1 Tax=Lederbergia citrisecunda TaxID=2833583 RepID=A0A942TKR6_9BACI|nr:transglutaminase family protein [Lederbergia citrisecunda]MBS4198541.1 transglutaminase family protein [Lederbergia citrisecunda]